MQTVSTLHSTVSPLEQRPASSLGIRGRDDRALGCCELRLLLVCLRANLRISDQLLLTELLAKDTSWDYVLSMAAWHGVIPLIARHLVGRPEVPSSVVESLRESSFAHAASSLRLSAEWSKLSGPLDSQGIPHIAYKGAILSQYLYGSTALRSASDIDLIIRQGDIHKAIACLEELGFEDGFGFSASQRTTAIRCGFEYSFVRNGVTVDLHWRLAQNFCWPSLDMDRVWKSLVPFSFFGREVRIFSPECMLTALCIHSAQHDWMQLKLFVDIAELLAQHPNLDWRLIENLTGDSHSRRSMNVALSLTHTYLGSPLPPQVAETMANDRQVKQIADRVYSKFWPSPQHPFPVDADMDWLLSRTKGERWIDRWRYLAGMVFGLRMTDFRSFEIPSSLAWLYFAVRPLRILSGCPRKTDRTSFRHDNSDVKR